MKKEYIFIVIIALFILSSALDYLAGPQKPVLTNPFDFWKNAIISVYPFTAVSIIIKSIALFVSLLFGLSFIDKKYFAKGIFLLFITGLFELYSIQQIATGSLMVSLEWALALAATGVVLLLPTTFFVIIGGAKLVHKNLKQISDPYSQPEEVE